MCCLCLYRFVGFRGVSATPTPQISWHKTTSARLHLLCHPLCTKSNKHMLSPAYAFVNAEKAHLCRSPCEHYGSVLLCKVVIHLPSRDRLSIPPNNILHPLSKTATCSCCTVFEKSVILPHSCVDRSRFSTYTNGSLKENVALYLSRSVTSRCFSHLQKNRQICEHSISSLLLAVRTAQDHLSEGTKRSRIRTATSLRPTNSELLQQRQQQR